MTVDEIEAKHPGIFGPNGGYSRALSLASMSWTAGSFVGPILSGFLVEQIGYYEMNCVMGWLTVSPTTLHLLIVAAGLCAVTGIFTFFNLDNKVHFERVGGQSVE